METTVNKTIATLLQLSALTQYFFPFGNFIFPLVIWTLRKDESKFVDQNGKQALNFQLSLLLYTFILLAISIPVLVYNVINNISFSVIDNCQWVLKDFSAGKMTTIVLIAIIASFLFLAMKVAEFILIIYAAVKNNNGESYKYPVTIPFLK